MFFLAAFHILYFMYWLWNVLESFSSDLFYLWYYKFSWRLISISFLQGKFPVSFCLCREYYWYFHRYCIESVRLLVTQFYNINSVNARTWEVFPSSLFCFIIFLVCSIVFIVKSLTSCVTFIPIYSIFGINCEWDRFSNFFLSRFIDDI